MLQTRKTTEVEGYKRQHINCNFMDIELLKKESSFLGLIALKCPLEKTLDCFSQLGWFNSEGWTIKKKCIDSDTNVLKLLDLSVSTYNQPETNIIWEPRSTQGTTVFRTTSEGVHSALYNCLAKMDVECYLIRICNHKGYAAYTFERRKGDRKSVRCIQYIQDSPRSEFCILGNPLPFENESYYSRRFKKDRINADIIIEYMAALGWDMLDDSFWISDKQAYFEIREFTGR